MGDHDDDDDDEAMTSTVVGMRAPIPAGTSQVRSRRPWLVILSGSGSVGKMYRLETKLMIGRSLECDVRIDEDGVSRRHARVEQAGDKVQLVDLDSRNGTFVNGEPVSRTTVSDGDKIQIGPITILKLTYQDHLDEALQRTLYESAMRDPLTGAANRRSFEEALAKEVAFSARHGRPLSAVALDVDHFKRVNDAYGHPAGDAVLRGLVEIVSSKVRGEDLFARIGGEEFALLLRDISSEGARQCAERLRRAVEQATFEHNGVRIPVTISAGVATLTADMTPEALVKEADRQLYLAKQAGRNRVCAAAPHAI